MRAAGGGSQTIAAIAGECGSTKARTEFLRKIIVGDDDAALDQHLTHWDVQAANHGTEFCQLVARLQHQQGVGALIDGDAATLGQQAALAALEQGGHLCGLGVIDLDDLAAQRGQRELGFLGLCFHLFALGDFTQWGDQHHIALLAQAQTLGAEDDVQRLVPRHILQAHGDLTIDAIAHHHIGAGDIGNDLQERADVDALEAEADALTGVDGRILFALIDFLLRQWLQLQRKGIARLVGHLLEVCTGDGGHGQHRVDALARDVDELHRCRKIEDVQAAYQLLKRTRVLEPGDHLAALLTHIDRRARVRQRNDHAALAALAATEVHATHVGLLRCRDRCCTAWLGGGCYWRWKRGSGGRCTTTGIQFKEDLAAINPHAVGHGFGEFHHHAGAALGLCGCDCAGFADVHALVALGQSQAGVRKIQR